MSDLQTIDQIEEIVTSSALLVERVGEKGGKRSVDLRRIEEARGMLARLERFASQTGGLMPAFDRALRVLEMRARYGTAETLVQAHGYVQQAWRGLDPCLRRLAAAGDQSPGGSRAPGGES